MESRVEANSMTMILKITKGIEFLRVPLMALLVLAGISYISRGPLWPGFIVAAIGEMFQLWAASQLHKDRVLSDSGPYAHVRNPMYVGRFLLLLGFLMLTQNWYVVIVYVLAYSYYVRARVAREEARLRGIFGEPYIQFCKEVPRFFPRLTPYKKTSGRRLTWTGVVRNHEYRNAVGLVAVLFLIVWRVNEYHGIAGMEFFKKLLGN